jgi:hypothetical protein
VKLPAGLLLLIALPLLGGSSQPVARSEARYDATIRPCPTAAQVLKDFIAGFNSGDGRRASDLIGVSIQLVDDLPGDKFVSQERQEVLSYLTARIALGERFVDFVIAPGIQTNVAEIAFARVTPDGPKLFGKGKGVTSVTEPDHITDCHHLSTLIMFGRPTPSG